MEQTKNSANMIVITLLIAANLVIDRLLNKFFNRIANKCLNGEVKIVSYLFVII